MVPLVSTGKTTTLINIVGQELEGGRSPAQVVYVSFTKVAARVAADRARDKFPWYPESDFKYFATIHSICFSLLGLARSDVFSDKELRKFGHDYGYEFSPQEITVDDPFQQAIQDMAIATKGEFFEAMYNYWRNSCLPLNDAIAVYTAGGIPFDFDRREFSTYIARRNEYKKNHLLYDFPDMLSEVLAAELYPRSMKVLIADECQDNSNLLNSVIQAWVPRAERVYLAGDPYQCLPAGTPVATSQGKTKVEELTVGDTVLCSIGGGNIGSGKITDVYKALKPSLFAHIKTESGKTLSLTCDHRLFCFVPNKETGWWYLYLMYKEGWGWRLGITKIPQARIRLEAYATHIVIFDAYQTEEEARFFELYYSLKYGIPTLLFYPRDYEGSLSKQVLREAMAQKLFKMLNTESRVNILAADQGIDLNFPQYFKQAVTVDNPKTMMAANRAIVNVQFCYRPDSRTTSHFINLETSDKGMLSKLREAGYTLHQSKRGSWRLRLQGKDLGLIVAEAQKISSLLKVPIRTTHSVLTPGGSQRRAIMVTAGNICPGLYVPVIKNGKVQCEKVVQVNKEFRAEEVYDLNVENYHNYFANDILVHNCIYSWSSADPRLFMDFPADQKTTLKQSYRCPKMVHRLSRQIVDRFRTRYEDDDYLPTDEAGRILTNIDFDVTEQPTFWLFRTRYLLSQTFDLLYFQGVPFLARRGKKTIFDPKKDKKRRVASRLLALPHEPVTLSDLSRIIDYLPSKHHGESLIEWGMKRYINEEAEVYPDKTVRWQDLLNIGFTPRFMQYRDGNLLELLREKEFPVEEKSYIRRLVMTYGRAVLDTRPRLELGTFHSVKGDEAVRVIIDPSYTRKPYSNFVDGNEEEHRLIYTAITRSSGDLVILPPSGPMYYPVM